MELTVLATQERVRTDGRTVIVWHKAAEPEQCNGECDWHPIACSSIEGIVAPGGLRDVPVELGEPGQRWCGDCLAIMRAAEKQGARSSPNPREPSTRRAASSPR